MIDFTRQRKIHGGEVEKRKSHLTIAFVETLIETGVDLIAADMPNANKVMIQMHAVMSEYERDQISERTRAVLAPAKAMGVRLGVKGAENLEGSNEARTAQALLFRE